MIRQSLRFNSKAQDIIACVLFLFFVPLLAHLLFSWMGFIFPGDDGLNLAFSRRLLEGQVPHRDFINLRPIGSALLHLPFVLFGGNHTFWISRFFAWFQFACISWAWTTVILKTSKIPLSLFHKLLLAVIAFIFTTHVYPVMAWYATDALFFSSLSLSLCVSLSERKKLLGYTLLGAAYLCKQSFLLIIPIFLWTLGDWRQKRYGLATAIPGIVYFAYLGVAGAIPDAVLQLTLHTNDFFSRGIKSYFLHCSVPWGMVLGYFVMSLLLEKVETDMLATKVNLQKWAAVLLLYGVLFGIPIALNHSIYGIFRLSFGLFGVVLGATACLLLEEKRLTPLTQVSILVLSMGWVVSLSLSYNTPALASGPLAILLIAYCYHVIQSTDKNSALRKLPSYLSILLLIVSVICYGSARQKYGYQNRPAQELTRPLDGLLPGGYRIKTNQNTYEFLVDLREAIEKTKGQDFALVPGLHAYWVKSPKKNPLPIDWILVSGEMNNKRALVDRVLDSLDNHRGKITVLLQKVVLDDLTNDFKLLSDGEVPRYVRSHFTKISETRFFELYQ